MLAESEIEKYLQAGKIAAEVREKIKRKICEGMLVIRICEQAESLIQDLGGTPAFPCNVSINHFAAHYTSPPNDKNKIPSKSVVKIDIGVHIDGYIADTATTVCFNPEFQNLVNAAESALRKAISILKPGLRISKFGSQVQRTIENRGFKPITNLTGHQIKRYSIHAGKTLPNVATSDLFNQRKIRQGEIYAIEPFVTMPNAAGRVEETSEAYIYRFIKRRHVVSPSAKRLLRIIENNFRNLPFAGRWLKDYELPHKVDRLLPHLLSSRSIIAYPVFAEASEQIVAQAEHTVLLEKDGTRVLTQI